MIKTGIYKITNKLNNKCYIGQSVDIQKRWNWHKSEGMKPTSKQAHYVIYRALRKYGIKNFEFKILELCEKEKLTERERYWYDYYSPEYNMLYPNSNPIFNPEIEKRRQLVFKTDDYKDKKRKISLQVWKRPEYISKMKLIQKQNGKKLKEKYNSIYYKKLFSKKQDNQKVKIKVIKNEKVIKTFPSYTEGAKWVLENNLSQGQQITILNKIRAVCEGKRPNAYKHQWSKV